MYLLLCKEASSVKGITLASEKDLDGNLFTCLWQDWGRTLKMHLALFKAAQLPGYFAQPCWKTNLIKYQGLALSRTERDFSCSVLTDLSLG